MKKNDNQTNLHARQAGNEVKNKPEGYPLYPTDDDIYSKYHEDKNINPDHISQREDSSDLEEIEISRENDLDIEIIEDRLTEDGLELGNSQENTGCEDEENDYYSLGGDDHENLEEDQS